MTRTEQALMFCELEPGTRLRIRYQPDAGKRSSTTHEVRDRSIVATLLAYYESSQRGPCIKILDLEDDRHHVIGLDQIRKVARYLGSRDERARAAAAK